MSEDQQAAFKRGDRVEITGPDDKGNAQYLGLHGRVVTKTAGTGAFWLHSLEERWYIPGFYPASSLRLLPEVKARPPRPAFPTCSTCSYWQEPVERCDGTYGDCPELTGSFMHGVYFQDPTGTSLQGLHSTPSTFGCLLHSDLTEAGA